MGELVWAIKESFVGYVEGVGGLVEIRDGARRDDAGFHFPEQSAPKGKRLFGGEVCFRAHEGLLAVTLAGLAVVDDELRCRRPHNDDEMLLARLEPTGEGGHRVALTSEGAALFGGQYAAGQQMADLILA